MKKKSSSWQVHAVRRSRSSELLTKHFVPTADRLSCATARSGDRTDAVYHVVPHSLKNFAGLYDASDISRGTVRIYIGVNSTSWWNYAFVLSSGSTLDCSDDGR